MSEIHTPPDTGRARADNGDAMDDGIGRAPGASSLGPPAVGRSRHRRVSKWDRPPAPHDWRWFARTLGKVLLSVGLLMFGFVAYQLYGTGIQTAAAQNRLENEFEELLAEASPVTAPPVTVGSTVPAEPVEEPVEEPVDTAPGPVPVENQNLVQMENGDALARIEIPAIGVDDIVVAGVETSDLRKGPGHFPDTPLPGQLGNSAIAGHRTTYGQPFRNVDQLEPGDEIRITTLNGLYVYRITGTTIVAPSFYEAVATTDPTVANLTLISCHPVFTARERIVTSSELIAEESSPIGEPVLDYGRPTRPDDAGDTVPVDDSDDPTFEASTPATDELGTDEVNAGIADAFSEGWFSDPGANTQIGLWGLAVSAIALGSYAISRRVRHDSVGLLIGIAPFMVALYFFFENVNRLLPPSL